MATTEGGDSELVADQLELVPGRMEDATLDVEPESGFESTAQALRKSLRGTHYDILQKAITPASLSSTSPCAGYCPCRRSGFL